MADIIPVDIVSNMILAAAWHQAVLKPTKLTVFNCVSGNKNPITWGDFIKYMHKGVLEYPHENVVWYPADLMHKPYYCEHFLKHTIPARLADIVLWLCGKPSQ